MKRGGDTPTKKGGGRASPHTHTPADTQSNSLPPPGGRRREEKKKKRVVWQSPMMRQTIQKSPADALDEFWQLGGGVGSKRGSSEMPLANPARFFKKKIFSGFFFFFVE